MSNKTTYRNIASQKPLIAFSLIMLVCGFLGMMLGTKNVLENLDRGWILGIGGALIFTIGVCIFPKSAKLHGELQAFWGLAIFFPFGVFMFFGGLATFGWSIIVASFIIGIQGLLRSARK